MAQKGHRALLGSTALLPVDLKEPIRLAFSHYRSSQSLADLDKRLELWRTVRALAETESLTYQALVNLSVGLTERHRLTGNDTDLGERIDTMRSLVALSASQPRDDLARCTAMLGFLLLHRYSLHHSLEDLDTSIAALRQARELLDDSETVYKCLVNALRARADALGQRSDFDEVIELTGRRLVAKNADYWDWPVSLEEVCRARLSALNTTGDARVRGPDESLDIFRKLSPTGVSEESVLIRGAVHLMLFHRYGESFDLDRAIGDCVSQLERGPTEIKEEILLLRLLSSCLMARYSKESHPSSTSDIDEAITLQNRAIELASTAGAPPGYSRSLTRDLAGCYRARFYRGQSHDITDLNRAIEIYRSVSVSNDVKPEWYRDYGRCLQYRWYILRDSATKHEMISVFEEGVRRLPEQHKDRLHILLALATSRMYDFLFDKSRPGFYFIPSRAKEVLMTFVDAANAAAADDVIEELVATLGFSGFYAQCHMLKPSLDWVQDFVDPGVVKNMQSRFLDRLSETMWLGHTVSRRYQEAAMYQAQVSAAVANALVLKDNGTALECFEQGRAVVWSQIHNLRTPLDDLRETHPGLAEKLQKLSLELESAGRRAPLPLQGPSDILTWAQITPVEEQAVAGRRLAREHKALLEHIRSLCGFETFLRPKGADALLKAVESRAVACINVHVSRCDALIIFGSNMHHVRLPHLTPAKIKGWHVKLTNFLRRERARAAEPRKGHVVHLTQHTDDVQDDPIRDVLRELWDYVVWPILEVYMDNSEGDRRHITWCTTGQLAFLPLHAAGPHNGKSLNAFDLVISSYAPNLSSLLPPTTVLVSPSPSIPAVTQASTPAVSAPSATVEESAKVPGPQDGAFPDVVSSSVPNETSPSSPSILVVAQPNTPDESSLPGTVEESEKVAANFPTDSAQVLLSEYGTTKAVLENMATHPYVHLACHGQQDADPMKSAFFLHDGRLTLQTLMAHKSSNAQLAFLSACETATGDATVPNEAVHLAAGMLAAGYKSVVATMWSIGDNEAPRVADEFYRALLADPERKVAFALHTAVLKLREHVGVENFVKWMPFIHLGL